MSKDELEALKLRSEIAKNLENVVPTEYIWTEILGLSEKIVKKFKSNAYFDLNTLELHSDDCDGNCGHKENDDDFLTDVGEDE